MLAYSHVANQEPILSQHEHISRYILRWSYPIHATTHHHTSIHNPYRTSCILSSLLLACIVATMYLTTSEYARPILSNRSVWKSIWSKFTSFILKPAS